MAQRYQGSRRDWRDEDGETQYGSDRFRPDPNDLRSSSRFGPQPSRRDEQDRFQDRFYTQDRGEDDYRPSGRGLERWQDAETERGRDTDDERRYRGGSGELHGPRRGDYDRASGYGSAGYGSGAAYGGYSSPDRGRDFGNRDWGRRDGSESKRWNEPDTWGGASQDRGRSDRGFMERASDEIASWMGDEEAARRREADHRGKGPRGYQRSDERIQEDVNDRLSEDRAIDASDINVSVRSGEVTLTGEVASKAAKRLAEDCADSVSGVQHVQNNLRVRASGYGTSGSTSTTGSVAGSGSSQIGGATTSDVGGTGGGSSLSGAGNGNGSKSTQA